MAPVPLPALFPPADGTPHKWPPPNYVNPHTRDWTASACLIALFIITVGVFFARINARFFITRTSGVDDWLIIATMPVLLGFMISTILGLRVYGFQLHIYDQTPRTRLTVRQITLAIEILYLVTTSITKISILTFYRRLTSSLISRPLLIIIRAAIAFVAAYGISFVFVLLFTCWPVQAYWYRFSPTWLQTHTYKCHNELEMLLIIISISTAQDLIACILPMFIIRKMRLPWRQKLALAAIFGVGLAVCGIGALRVHYAHRVYHYVTIKDPTYDITWEALGAWVATAVEANVAVICASAPALKAYCRCMRTPAQNPRDFNWYHGGSSQESEASCFSNASGKVRGMIPCLRSKVGNESGVSGTSRSNDVGEEQVCIDSREMSEVPGRRASAALPGTSRKATKSLQTTRVASKRKDSAIPAA